MGDGVYQFQLEAGEREVRIWAGMAFYGEDLILSIPAGGTIERSVTLRERERKEEQK
jgi:hypothetical protein